MIVKQIWTGNAFRNFNYLIVCPETGDAAAIDPLDHKKCLSEAKKNGWNISKIINTHEHGDHIGGNQQVVKATGAKVLAHLNAKNSIPEMTQGLSAKDIVKIGRTIELECLDTPGHTMSHICLLSHTDQVSLFCGDTLFNAGAGNCHNGGHPFQLYMTFVNQLAQLPDDTNIFPGHDYIENNLKFTLDREPNNTLAEKLLGEVQEQDENNAFVSTLALEKQVNTFFRLQNQTIIDNLKDVFPELGKQPSDKDIFTKLRELRNNW